LAERDDVLFGPDEDDTMTFPKTLKGIHSMEHDTSSRRSRLLYSRVALTAILLPLSNLHGQITEITKKPAVLPASVDLRPALNAFGLTPRVQGKRGTCSVFAMTQALEFAFAKKDDRGERFSAEFLNWASNRATNDKEDGGFFSDLWTGFAAHGLCLESMMPYEATYNAGIEPSPAARKEAEPRREAGLELHWIKAWDPKRGLADDELRRVREILAAGWPVCGGFLWPKKAVWTKGVLETCPRDQVFDGHSLLLVGYKDDPNQPGGGILLIRNSGGSDRDGCVTYEYAKAYMNDAVWISSEKASDKKK
jgi:hypothetical protein